MVFFRANSDIAQSMFECCVSIGGQRHAARAHDSNEMRIK